MSNKIYNGIIHNGIKHEAVEIVDINSDICEKCSLQELCDEVGFQPCELFEGDIHFRLRR